MVGLPLSIINEVSGRWLLLPEAPQVVTRNDTLKGIVPLRSSFGVPDGLGINFSGSYWKWFYSLSVVNGNESNYNINWYQKKMAVGFRTGFNILDPVGGSLTDFDCSTTPKLTVSVGMNYLGKRLDDTLTTPAEIKYKLTGSGGVALRWAGFALTTEFFYRSTKMNSLGSSPIGELKYHDMGYYGDIGYYVIPKKLELALQGGQSIRQGPANNSWEIGGGINYYIFGNNLKLQLAYTASRFYDWIAATTTTSGTTTTTTGSYSRLNTNHNVTLMASAFF